MKTYERRKTDYKQAHGFSESTLTRLAESLDLFEGARVLDLMAGRGTVAEAIGRYYAGNGVNVSPALHDGYRAQLPEEPKYPIIVCDAKKITVSDESFDGIAVKLGLHEIHRADKLKVFDEAYRILKEGRYFSMWEIALEDNELQRVYQQIVRKKDELAGFWDLVENRYFMRLDEIFHLLAVSGFVDSEVYFPDQFCLDTSRYCNFEGNQSKLNEFNSFIRRIVPEQMRSRIEYRDSGSSISMKVNQPIVRARKARHENLFLDLHTKNSSLSETPKSTVSP
jgi:ubiquinone/menaquinone biosynthesis C-methylase UbiE